MWFCPEPERKCIVSSSKQTFTKAADMLLNMSHMGSLVRRGYTGLCPLSSWCVPSTSDWLHQILIGFSFGSPGSVLHFGCHRTKLDEDEGEWM